jgi:hypothetical protein
MPRDLRIFIRHSVSGQFFTSEADWTRDIEEARMFESVEDGLDYLRLEELDVAELVIKPEMRRERRYSCARLRKLKL